MGAREVHFDREVAPSLSLRAPACSFAAVGDEGAFVLLLEDLAAPGAAISAGSWAVPGRLVRAALAELAELHVRYEEPAWLASVAKWAAAPRGSGTTSPRAARSAAAPSRSRTPGSRIASTRRTR
jgi:hypothetical protein